MFLGLKNKRLSHAGSRGFTLIELLVVIAIIGLLSSVVLTNLNAARAKARNAARIADIKQYQIAMELAFNSLNRYPAATGINPNTFACLGDHADNGCWHNNNISEDDGLSAEVELYISPRSPGPGQVLNWEGYAYRCMIDNSCPGYIITWFQEGDNESCGPGVEVPNQGPYSGATYCQVVR